MLNNNVYKPFTLVSAGAGYGKSMLISAWLENSKLSYAWISLSKEDNNLRNFIDGVYTAVRKKFPRALSNLGDLFESNNMPPLFEVIENLINGLDIIKKQYVLVLDDYHIIQNKEIHVLINTMLQFPPQYMHLVIMTRRDPPLNVNFLRTHSRINEIRMTDLSFSVEETIDLFRKLHQIDLSEDLAQKLILNTEGWITALRLTSLAIRKEANPKKTIKYILNDSSINTHVLLKEIILNQPKEIQSAMVKMSILDRFCEELIDELCFVNTQKTESSITGREIIQSLLEANFFTIPLDNEQKWFRFHHLIQELLLNRFKEKYTADEIKASRLAVSSWLDKYNYKEEAIIQAIKSGDLEVAVELIEGYRYEMMDTGEMNRLNQLIDLLPEDNLKKNPELLISKAFIMDFRGQISEIFSFRDMAKQVLSEKKGKVSTINKSIIGEIKTIDAEEYLFKGDWKNAQKSSKKALEFISPSCSHIYSYAFGAELISYQMAGNLECIWKVAAKYPIHTNLAKTRLELWYAIVFAMEGNTNKLEKHAKKLINLGKKHQFLESVYFGRYFLSVSYFLSNKLQKAKPHLEEVLKSPSLVRPNYLVQCTYMLASLYHENGEKTKAEEVIKRIKKFVNGTPGSLIISILDAMSVELAIKFHSLERALALNKQLNTYKLLPLLWFLYIPQLTQIKLKLALNTVASVEEALELIKRIEERLWQTNNKTILIEVLVLQALAFKKQKNIKTAMEKLEKALSISQMGNCIHAYIDHGSQLKELLLYLPETHINSVHIRAILGEIEEKERLIAFNGYSERPQVSITPTPNITLSMRELDVLRLVAQGLRNKEISEQLFVSTGTIKKHIYNIGQKLGAGSRINMVNLAKQEGII